MFKLEIKTGGSAFCDPFTGEEDGVAEAAEIRRILERVSCELENGATSGSVMDVNGNKVGNWNR